MNKEAKLLVREIAKFVGYTLEVLQAAEKISVNRWKVVKLTPRKSALVVGQDVDMVPASAVILAENKKDHRETFEETGSGEVPDSVANVSGMAADNADTMITGDRYGEDGKHSDEFICHWYLSVSSILASASGYFSKEESAEVRAWYEARGIDY